MLYQHPLVYLLGLQGVALLRAWGGHYGQDFVAARIAEIRGLLEDMERWGDGATAREMSVTEVYASWAPFYDEPGNAMIDIEQPRVREILDRTEPGVALDAGCGTGRHAEYLDSLGHTVIGVDTSAEMLEVARQKLPDAPFHHADLTAVPLPDAHVDLIVCGLTLCHVPDLAAVFAEFARLLRPGGQLVISDTRGLLDNFDHPISRYTEAGEAVYVPNRHHSAVDYLTAALPAGFEVTDCAELKVPRPYVDDNGAPPNATGPAPAHVPDTMPNVWALHQYAAEATNAAFADVSTVIIWQLRRAAN